jgi:hypothetical protein
LFVGVENKYLPGGRTDFYESKARSDSRVSGRAVLRPSRYSLQCVEASFGRQSRETVERTALQEWAEFWNDWRKVPAAFSILHNLHLKLHSRVAAGFEIIARKA